MPSLLYIQTQWEQEARMLISCFLKEGKVMMQHIHVHQQPTKIKQVYEKWWWAEYDSHDMTWHVMSLSHGSCIILYRNTCVLSCCIIFYVISQWYVIYDKCVSFISHSIIYHIVIYDTRRLCDTCRPMWRHISHRVKCHLNSENSSAVWVSSAAMVVVVFAMV